MPSTTAAHSPLTLTLASTLASTLTLAFNPWAHQLARAQAQPAPTPAAQPASSPNPQLPQVLVKGSPRSGAGAYAPGATSLGKGQHQLRELPHSVTVMTRSQLTDQNIVNVETALKNVTGITVQRFDATGSYTQFIARGYAADSYQLDGLNLQTDTNGIYFDLAAFDRVEVQRGAASLFSGAGEPGVTVNIARKRALGRFQAEGAISLSSWNDGRLDLDVTGPLNATGSSRGRLVGVAQDFDTYMDGIDNNRKRLLYGTWERDLGDDTTLSVGATWQAVDTVLSRGLPTWKDSRLIRMPRSTMPVQSWSRQALNSQSAFAELEHQGPGGALLKLALRHMRRGNDAAYLDPSVPKPDGTMNALSAAAFARQDSDDTADAYYSQPFVWAGQKHHLLVGADYRRARATVRFANYTSFPGTVALNLFQFTPHAIPEPAFNLDDRSSRVNVTAYGAYTQLRLKPGANWTLIGGGRLGSWKSEGANYGTPADFNASNKFVPYAAAIVDVVPQLSLYGSYNEIFKAQNARTADGQQIAPRTGRQIELGLKGNLGDLGDRERQFSYTAAAYRLIDQNRALPDAAHPAFSTASGKARAQGAEVDFKGELSPSWSLSGGYAYTHTQYLKNTPALQGTAVSSITPRHNVNLWARYQPRAAAAPAGLVLGLGLRGMSDFYNGTGAAKVRGPGYTVFALHAAYPLGHHYRVSLNIDNLFDKVYWEKVSYSARQNFFGEPRRFTVAVRGSF